MLKALSATNLIFGRDDLGLYFYEEKTGAYRLLTEKGNYKTTFQYFLLNVLPDKSRSYALKKVLLKVFTNDSCLTTQLLLILMRLRARDMYVKKMVFMTLKTSNFCHILRSLGVSCALMQTM